ncbi:class I histocompatibility antigen, F10 alpha chain-like isoform 2-T2 [Discoglossus pictus]
MRTRSIWFDEIGFLFLYLLVFGVSCDTHTLQYYLYTVTTPSSDVHLFSAVGYIDDIESMRYSSNSKRMQPLHQWMEDLIDPKHWDMMTHLGHQHEIIDKKIADEIYRVLNRTQGIYTYQIKFFCELRDDGSIGASKEFGFNGNDLIAFDKDWIMFVPLTQEAGILTQLWNKQTSRAARIKDYLERDCIDWMKIYIAHGKNKLQRKVSPQVKVSGHYIDGVTKLHCQVYGFYPRDVDVKWVKNGIDDVYSEEAKQILPNPDGTYQTRVTVEVTPKEGDSYYCHVDHSSLETAHIVKWDPQNGSTLLIVMGVFSIIVVFVIAVIGYKVIKKRSNADQRHGNS